MMAQLLTYKNLMAFITYAIILYPSLSFMYTDSLVIGRTHSTSNPSKVHSGDFGVAIQVKKTHALTDTRKYFLSTKHFVPSNAYVFPSKTFKTAVVIPVVMVREV